jgi:UDPglucose 6-dehydrogenase
VTEWPEFAELDLVEVAAAMRGTLVIDGRNFLDPDAVIAAGLSYEGVGRAARTREPASAAQYGGK